MMRCNSRAKDLQAGVMGTEIWAEFMAKQLAIEPVASCGCGMDTPGLRKRLRLCWKVSCWHYCFDEAASGKT